MELRRRGGRLEYLVDCEGYRSEKRCWVVRADVLDPMLLEEFHHVHPDHPAPRGRGRPRHRTRVSGANPGGGAVSGMHFSHLSHHPPQSPDNNHLSSDQSPVTCNQDTIQKHAPSSHSLAGLPFTTPKPH